jgi:AraC family transcriptional regulator
MFRNDVPKHSARIGTSIMLHAMPAAAEPWKVDPRPANHMRFAWDGGVFETASRSFTPAVEGTIASQKHLVMVTLRGGARRHEFVTDCGYRYSGEDRRGFVSFLPAGCGRRLRLADVAWEWASIALPVKPETFDDGRLRCFSSREDPFVAGLLGEFHRLLKTDGTLDATYCDTMTAALVRYIERRHLGGADAAKRGGLTARQLRQVSDYVEARLGESIRIAALASLVSFSEGHFQRAFRDTTGQTPLQFVNARRVQRSMELLAIGEASVIEVALEVGFSSPGYFARVFSSIAGMSPARYRSELTARG